MAALRRAPDLGGTWSTAYHSGYVHSSDIQQGFDVLELTEPAPASAKGNPMKEFSVRTQPRYIDVPRRSWTHPAAGPRPAGHHNAAMRLDHVSYAAGPEGLEASARRLAEELGVDLVDGGVHPRFGTRNKILPLARDHYLEVVAVLDHPAADKVPFGQAVKARTEAGGGWLGWVVAVDDIGLIEARLGRSAVPGNRHRPDGVELHWRQVGVKGLINDPQLPFFLQWESDWSDHPSRGGTDVDLARVEIAGDPQRVAAWLGEPENHPLDDVDVDWIAPNGTPGIMAVHFLTPVGVVRI